MRRAAWLSLLVMMLAGTTQFLFRMLVAAAQSRDTAQAAWVAGGCLIAFTALWRGLQAWSEAWRRRK